MSYHHLTISERIRIEVLSILGYSTRFIAKFLHRHHSTIARELSRNKFENNYCSTSAHNNYLKRRKNSSHSSKYNDVFSNLISEKLHENWSPEQISNALLNDKLSFKTIYNWIYIGKGTNSEFQIPVTIMDESMPVIADTTAMGTPHEINYTLTFYSDSIGSKSQMPQEAAKRVVAVALVIIIGGGILNYFVNKRNRC